MWYARYRFRKEAEELVRQRNEEKLTGISELSHEERKECLKRTHAYFAQQKVLQFRGRGSGFVEFGKGPGLDADAGDPGFAYNGSNKERGRVFKWYRKALFQDRLRELGWTKVGCKKGAEVHKSVTEDMCMRALRLTSDHLEAYPTMHAAMDEYAGPQCYPQLADEERYKANNEPEPVAAEEVRLGVPAAREQMRCWLRCDEPACRRWRLVDRRSFDAVSPAHFQTAKRGSEGSTNWSDWFAAAPQRYAASEARHALRRSVWGGDAGRGCRRS